MIWIMTIILLVLIVAVIKYKNDLQEKENELSQLRSILNSVKLEKDTQISNIICQYEEDKKEYSREYETKATAWKKAEQDFCSTIESQNQYINDLKSELETTVEISRGLIDYDFLCFLYPDLPHRTLGISNTDAKEIVNCLLLAIEKDAILEQVDFSRRVQEIKSIYHVVCNTKHFSGIQQAVTREIVRYYNWITIGASEQELVALWIDHIKSEMLDKSTSNLTILPYMAGITAQIETFPIAVMKQTLEWGDNKMRKEKSVRLSEIKAQMEEKIEQYSLKAFQYDYAVRLYPGLEDILCSDYEEIKDLTGTIPIEEAEHDAVLDYLSPEEYASLSVTQRNQLALDRYIQGRKKNKWQIGRDYELSVGHEYEHDGGTVEYVGSLQKLEDLGRDLIVHTSQGKIIIVQCKYWSQTKTIHEKHIMQLFGTVTEYRISHPEIQENAVSGILITNTVISDTARQFAEKLGIRYRENHAMKDFPRIKCNISRDRDGVKTYIYHLPMDQAYDATKIDAPGEMWAYTVEEAEKAGFRRAFRWHGES